MDAGADNEACISGALERVKRVAWVQLSGLCLPQEVRCVRWLALS